LRGRGGNNRGGMRRLAHLLDEEVLIGHPLELALKFGVSKSTIFAERRLRKCNLQLSAPQPTSTP
jgi:hypothetical protein